MTPKTVRVQPRLPIAIVPGSGYGLPIGCFLVLFAFISPRLALFALWLFSDLLSRAFDSWFVPLLGFFLLPWTTLAYAVMWSSSDRVSGFEWFIVILAFAIDLGSYANRDRARRASA
jgi:hypothetical protein